MQFFKLNIFILTLLLFISCEDVYDKERRYKQDLNSKFEKTLPKNVKNVFLDLFKNDNKYRSHLLAKPLTLNGKICAIQGDYDLNHKKIITIDHLLTKELIKNGHQITFDIKEMKYLIFTDTDLQNVGYYEDSEGRKADTASIAYNFIYLYNLNNNELSFVKVNKGSNPKKSITQSKNRREAPYGKIWYAEDYVDFLQSHNYLITNEKEKPKRFYSNEYVDYLEENDFLGLSD